MQFLPSKSIAISAILYPLFGRLSLCRPLAFSGWDDPETGGFGIVEFEGDEQVRVYGFLDGLEP